MKPRRKTPLSVLVWAPAMLLLPPLLACGDTVADTPPSAVTPEGPAYYGDVQVIIDAYCGGCHTEGNIAPFALSSLDDVKAAGPAIRHAVDSGTMPPWHPDDACNTYAHSRALPADDKARLLEWLDAGMAAGDPAESVVPEPAPELETDLSLPMAESYTPQGYPDDHRCFLIDWPETERRYITGFKVTPGRADLVHHVIAFAVSPDHADTFRAYDSGEEGPGYTCFGGPTPAGQGGGFGVGGATTRWIGSWVPGASGGELPAGTGIAIEPGSLIVMQMHYNSLSADPAPDLSRMDVKTAETVDRPAVVMPFTNFMWPLQKTMSIPAGEASVTHEVTFDPLSVGGGQYAAAMGLAPDEPFVIHNIGLHMHQLGVSGSIEVVRADEARECALVINDWDFNWQGSYQPTQPLVVNPGDALHLRCTFDNSAANQVVVDGQQMAPRDVNWGDGTQDEMCLGVVYVTSQ